METSSQSASDEEITCEVITVTIGAKHCCRWIPEDWDWWQNKQGPLSNIFPNNHRLHSQVRCQQIYLQWSVWNLCHDSHVIWMTFPVSLSDITWTEACGNWDFTIALNNICHFIRCFYPKRLGHACIHFEVWLVLGIEPTTLAVQAPFSTNCATKDHLENNSVLTRR
jgi:hypothetical protein